MPTSQVGYLLRGSYNRLTGLNRLNFLLTKESTAWLAVDRADIYFRSRIDQGAKLSMGSR